MSSKCKNYLNSICKPKNKINCIAWLLLNVFGCKFCETCREKSCNIKDGELCTDNIANYIREAVKEETPTADAVEVRHGEWKKLYDKAPRYVCTACNHLYNNREYKFCHNCGAKMDLERRSENEG